MGFRGVAWHTLNLYGVPSVSGHCPAYPEPSALGCAHNAIAIAIALVVALAIGKATYSDDLRFVLDISDVDLLGRILPAAQQFEMWELQETT